MTTVSHNLRERAGNLERYPFTSATMAEAALLAAKELREIADELEAAASAEQVQP